MMQNSSLEITDQEYLLKLRKEEFDLSFIHQLLKRIQAEQLFFAAAVCDVAEDIISKNNRTDHSARFDDLNDK